MQSSTVPWDMLRKKFWWRIRLSPLSKSFLASFTLVIYATTTASSPPSGTLSCFYEILNLAKRYLVVGEAILFVEETIANMSPSAVEVIPAAIIAHRMAEYSTSWLDLLGDNPRIPADIQFKIVEKKVVEGRIDTSTEVFRAHKFLLAMFSDVFQAQFFGLMGNAEEEVLVEETSIAAFKEFLRIIYSLHVINRIRITIKDVELLYEILNLSKRYLVDGAIALLERTIATVALTAAEAIPAAIIADKYKKLLGFESVSEKLSKNCSDRLNYPLTSLKKMREFLTKAESEYSGQNLKLILRLIAGGADDSCQRLSNSPVIQPLLLHQMRFSPQVTPIVIGGDSQSTHNSAPSTGTSEFANSSRFASPVNLNNMSKPRPRSGSFDSDVWNGGYHHSSSNSGYSGSPGMTNKSFYGNRSVRDFGLILSPPAKPYTPQTGLIMTNKSFNDKKSI